MLRFKVTCIMPTANRRRFVPLAIGYFLAQDYVDKELLILDDGEDSVADLIPAHAEIRYLREPTRRVLGAKRNLLCEMAAGDVIVHWDDDDWSATDRVSRQIAALQAAAADACGLDRVWFLSDDGRAAWEYCYPNPRAAWVYGASLCYAKDFWRRNRFPTINVGEDTRFVWAEKQARVVAMPDNQFMVAIVHNANVSPKQTRGSAWQPRRLDDVRGVMGAEDFARYGPSSRAVPAGARAAAVAPSQAVRGCQQLERGNENNIDEHSGELHMLTVARIGDLELPEFRALNSDRSLPRMRQWELPFALIQARLSDTMAVLDCTINPVDFKARIARLFPHVLYRHWNPLAGGIFKLPLGLPDDAFDRVVCVNTLEHLLRPQRDQLLKALARKLKPGGLLIITCDYYFDPFWSDPAVLKTGLIRADGTEVINGFNKIRPDDCIRICEANGLMPCGAEWETPQQHDGSLLLQNPPYPHACIGGVFSRGQPGEDRAKRRVLLALLTWNTREVSIESLQALMAEAKLLRRLGHEPYLCVCDNGSTDGTAEHLRSVDASIDVPHGFLFNESNLGNSRARNQILDYMAECRADYVLFMDGDIEVVPCSSYAMLRYMEHNGAALGCIGACSAGQTTSRAHATPAFLHIERVETTNLVAWTQYGMFRKEVFAEGIRFEEGGPFTGPGWGFEDNDLAFQMDVKGFVNQRFFGMTYLHRDARSSVRVMKGLGIDPNNLYRRRKQYVIDKWDPIAAINQGPLRYVRAIEMQL